MFKKALIALAFVIGAQCASAALPAFNQKFEKNGQPIAEKPLVARDFIEFRTARGFPLDGYKDLAGNPQSLSQARDRRRLGFLERHLPAQRAAHGRIPGEVQQAREPHPLRFHLARQEPEARDEVREEDEAPRDLHLMA